MNKISASSDFGPIGDNPFPIDPPRFANSKEALATMRNLVAKISASDPGDIDDLPDHLETFREASELCEQRSIAVRTAIERIMARRN
jgi:hypothetical protein